MKERFLTFFKKNSVVFLYIGFAITIELVSISMIGCKPILFKPFYPIILFVMVLTFLFLLRDKLSKLVLSIGLLVLQSVLNVGFVYLYDSNGTFFEWAMYNQRNDAHGTIEDLTFRKELITTVIVLVSVFAVAGLILMLCTYKKKEWLFKASKATRITMFSLMLLSAFSLVMVPIVNGFSEAKASYVDMYLYGSSVNKYQERGMSSNAIYELINGTIASKTRKYTTDGVNKFVFEQDDKYLPESEYFGVSQGNNFIYILVESFEWYEFMDRNMLTEEQSKTLYPNLNKFLEDSIYANNFYAREKTDTAELLALLGTNPTNKYTNYDFPDNSFQWSLPYMFKNSVETNGNTVKQIRSYHQNHGDTYNRTVLHKTLGFDRLVDITEMEEYGVVNTYNPNGVLGDRTSDAMTIEKMQEQMFPETAAGEQYFTFWLTFSMHGYYEERQMFKDKGYYGKMDDLGVFPKGLNKKADYLRTYAAAVMDFDKALGIMMDRLEENDQLDNTTIVLFGDHNTYYNNLSYYAKGIEERYNSELYRVPFMMYDKKVKALYEANEGTNAISKFTTTADMLPTILDIFGIKGYKNLYFGTSMFIKDVESIIYSRAYGIFVTDKLICYSVNNLLYTSDGFTKQDKNDFIRRAKIHLNKLEIVDKIYYTDYFANHEYVYP